MAESNNKNNSGRPASHFANSAESGSKTGASGSHFGAGRTQPPAGSKRQGASHLRDVEPTIRKTTGSRFASKHAASAGNTTAQPATGRRFASASNGGAAARGTAGVQPVAPVRASAAGAAGKQGAQDKKAGRRAAKAAGAHGSAKAKKPVDNEARRKRSKIVSTALIVVGVALLLVAGGLFIKAQLGYQQAQSTYSDLEQYAVKSSDGDNVPTVDFDALAAINPDIVGWIYIPGTVINYPVVQTSNNTTYLSKLFDLTGNGSGTIFMDMDNTSPGMADQQTTIYGHHMNDGSMFKAIDGTLSQDEFDKIGKVYYITRDTTYVLEPMFTAQVQDTYLNARTPNFTEGDTTLQSYLEDMLSQAKASSSTASQDIKSVDKVLTLVTCAGEIIPRTTRAAMVCKVVETQDRTGATSDGASTEDGSTDESAADGTDAAATEGETATTEGETATTEGEAATA